MLASYILSLRHSSLFSYQESQQRKQLHLCYSCQLLCTQCCREEALCIMNLLHRVMTSVHESYAPEVIVCQCGADGLAGDPMSSFNLTLTAYRHCLYFLLQWKLPLLLLGGGGLFVVKSSACVAIQDCCFHHDPHSDEFSEIPNTSTALAHPSRTHNTHCSVNMFVHHCVKMFNIYTKVSILKLMSTDV